MPERAGTGLLLDTDVTIDFCLADRSLLSRISTHVGRVHIAAPLLQEELSRHLDEAECFRLGLEMIEPELDQILAAGSRRGRLSFYDHLCLILARDHGCICVTNDKNLRKACSAEGLPMLWGLETLALLVKQGGLAPEPGAEAAWEIHRRNPRVTEVIVRRFLIEIGEPG